MLIALILNLEEALLSLLVFASSCGSDAKVPVEVILMDKVWSDGLEVDEHIIELLQDKEG